LEIIFRGHKRIKIRIIPEKSQDRIISHRTFSELEKIYSPVLFRDFDLINEATVSNSEAFMESVTAQIFARKIPLHSIINPLFYMPEGLTVLDTVMYLEPEKFRFIETISRNNEKIPFHAQINADDIITYSFGNTVTITQGSKKDVNSDISKWRIEQLRTI
jgi:(p)ppGpp synthase/HD superfamily hydrolase